MVQADLTGAQPDSAHLVTDPAADLPITLAEFQSRYDDGEQAFLLMGDVRHMRRVAVEQGRKLGALQSSVSLFLRGCLSADELAAALAKSERAA